ncbi:MAG: hypothetical protein ACOH2R_04935, partial [Pseudomonas sp.]
EWKKTTSAAIVGLRETLGEEAVASALMQWQSDCQIPLDDPFHLSEPPVSGTVLNFDAEKEQELVYYREQAKFAAEVYQSEKYGSKS